jgi:hypothetical protein
MRWIERDLDAVQSEAYQAETLVLRGILNLWLGRFSRSVTDLERLRSYTKALPMKEAFGSQRAIKLRFIVKAEIAISVRNIMSQPATHMRKLQAGRRLRPGQRKLMP